MSRWPGPQGIVGAVQRILSDGVPSVTTEVVDLSQSADDGTDRIIIRASDGTIVGEVYTDGTDVKFNAVGADISFDSTVLKDVTIVRDDGEETHWGDGSISGGNFDVKWFYEDAQQALIARKGSDNSRLFGIVSGTDQVKTYGNNLLTEGGAVLTGGGNVASGGGDLNAQNGDVTNWRNMNSDDGQAAVIRSPGDGQVLKIVDAETTGEASFIECKESGDTTPFQSSSDNRVEFPNEVVIEDGANLYIGDNVNDAGGVAFDQRPADPGTGELPQGMGMLYFSDGSADATGDAMDLIAAVNDGGTIETAIIMDESADAS